MEYTSRKQRKENEIQTEQDEQELTVEKADEVIFKEQKKRLRRQLNSVSTFSLDTNDMKIAPNTLRTRTEVKKQKKIDEILRDIAVLPETEYLNEDTNLRLLKKMSVAKKYNRLQLSPEQEEKMAENKEKFETITNQLWFLIRELEKGKVPEPEIGTIPTITSEEVSRNRSIFDVEQAKTAERKIGEHTLITDDDFEMTNMNTKIDLLEEKLEKISLKNDELEGVLQDLEKVVQEGKSIVSDEVEIQSYDIGEAPEDTLELLEYLEKLDELNKTKALQLEENKRKIEETNQIEQIKQAEALEQTKSIKENPVPTPEKKETFSETTIYLDNADTEKEAANTQEAVETKATEKSVSDVTPTKETDGVQNDDKKPEQTIETKVAAKTAPLVATKEVEVKQDKPSQIGLQKSIILLSVVFVILLIVLGVLVFYLWQQGGISF